jgi:uncharacterized membrane protein
MNIVGHHGKRLLALLLAAIGVLYPFLIYFGLKHFSLRVTSLVLLLFLGLRALFLFRGADWKGVGIFMLLAVNLFLAVVAEEQQLLLFSPVLISIGMFLIFASSLASEVSIIERFARAMDPDIPEHARQYCRKVTLVWCAFFLFNGSVACWMAFYASLELWTFYNGFLAYIGIGVLMAGEYIVRRGKIARDEQMQ